MSHITGNENIVVCMGCGIIQHNPKHGFDWRCPACWAKEWAHAYEELSK
jgi:predicted RNA-binding Zn-ribbon protein involved in translation (DUF1610 family)